MANQPQPASLSPEEIKYLVSDGALDDCNIPEDKSSPTKISPTTPTKIKVSRGLLNQRGRFFGSGTSKDDVVDILSQGDGNFSMPSTPSKKSSPSKKKPKSPIKVTRNHPVKSFIKNTSPKSPSPKASKNSSSSRWTQTPSPKDTSKSPKKSPSLASPSSKRHLVFASGSGSFENVIGGESEPANNKYYFEAFYFIVQSVRSDKRTEHLFTDQEKDILENFKKDLPELHLYVRLLNRQDSWKVTSSVKYPEIADDLEPLFTKLEKEGYITCDVTKLPLADLLNLLKIDGLKVLCKHFKLKLAKLKNEMVESLCRFQRTQPSFAAVHPLRKRAEEQLGRCFRLAPESRLLFRRCVLLFSMFHSNDELDKLSQTQGLLLLEVRRGNMIFPISAMDVSNDYHIFDNRDQFLRYEQARELRQDIYNFEKDADEVEALTVKALTEFRNMLNLKDEESSAALPLFLRRYRAGSVYARILENSAEKLRKGKNLELAKNALNALRDQNIYLPYRCGRWALILASLLHINCKDPASAAEELCRGFQLTGMSRIDRANLNSRAETILKKKKNGLSKDLEDKLRSVLDPPLKDPVAVEIQGRSTNMSKPGMKRIWVRSEADGGRVFRSVEEEVLEYYRNRGYSRGQHDEGRLIRSLCMLAMWDIIYDKTVPSVFLSQYQDKPLDWATQEFVATRSQKIQDRLEHIQIAGEEGLTEQLLSFIQQYGNTVSLVAWEYFEGLNIQDLLKCLTIPVFIAICRRLMEDFRAHRSGFPDLTLWDPDENKCLFIEVKGPNDKLSTAQILWLEALQRSGAEAVVASVRATGSREGQRT